MTDHQNKTGAAKRGLRRLAPTPLCANVVYIGVGGVNITGHLGIQVRIVHS